MILKQYIAVFVSLFVLTSCSNERSEQADDYNRVIIGISEDVDSFNPLFAFKVNEGNITELLYLSLVKHEWNNNISNIESQPMLAESWSWSTDSSSITFKLRENVYWSDSTVVTSDDIIFSFDVYSDPAVQSKLYGTFENFYTDEQDHISLDKTLEKLSVNKIKINFKKGSSPSLFDIDFPILPKHIYNNIKRENFQTAETNFSPITNGPYSLKNWEKNRSISLTLNKASYLSGDDSPDDIIFKIVPDYNSRILQLRKGEIDLIEDVKPEDAVDFDNDRIEVESIKGREYDYIGFNNIDVSDFKKNKITPHKLFGDKNVRKALTYAMNRQEILDEFIYNYGELAISPVTPIFKSVQNNEISPYEFNIKKAKQLLKKSGWSDSDNDGILEKKGIKFNFDLYIPTGSPRREYAATVFKNNLKAIGVNMKVQFLELGVFIDKLFAKEIDAWMAAWVIPLPIELKIYWYSNLEAAPLNFYSYQNPEIDKILDELENKISKNFRIELLKNFQKIIHEDEPVSFLYWVDNIVAYNSKINNIKINPLGAVHNCWEWKLTN